MSKTKKGAVVLAKRKNDSFQKQGIYFGKCRDKHIIDFTGVSAMFYDEVEVLPTLTKREAKQKVSELFGNNSRNATSQKVRDIIDLIK